MNLLPYEHFDMITKLTPDEAGFRLKNVSMLYNPARDAVEYEPGKFYLFVGKVTNGQFKLRKNENDGRKTIIPIIRVKISGYQNDSKIAVKVTLSYRILFSCFLLSIFEVLFIASGIASKAWPIVFLAIFTPPAAYFAIVFSLASEIVGIKATLRKVFS